jgi:CheY-like chemotaxis protein
MTKQQPEEILKLPTFGRRKVASRVCVVDGKPHVRKFLCEALEEIGFITRECDRVAVLEAVLDEPLGVDLIVVGAANGVQAATVIEAWRRKSSAVKFFCLDPASPQAWVPFGDLGPSVASICCSRSRPLSTARVCTNVLPLLHARQHNGSR